jgi:hypothetical protein
MKEVTITNDTLNEAIKESEGIKILRNILDDMYQRDLSDEALKNKINWMLDQAFSFGYYKGEEDMLKEQFNKFDKERKYKKDEK